MHVHVPIVEFKIVGKDAFTKMLGVRKTIEFNFTFTYFNIFAISFHGTFLN